MNLKQLLESIESALRAVPGYETVRLSRPLSVKGHPLYSEVRVTYSEGGRKISGTLVFDLLSESEVAETAVPQIRQSVNDILAVLKGHVVNIPDDLQELVNDAQRAMSYEFAKGQHIMVWPQAKKRRKTDD